LVGAPQDFTKYLERLSKGYCQTLHFDHSMDIFLEQPLVLDGKGSPVSITAGEGTTVRLIGWNGSDTKPGLTIRRSQVSLSNLIWRDFPGSAIRVEGNDVSLHKIRLLHNGTRGASALFLMGNDIQVKESEIAESGLHGVVITDENWPASCAATFPSHRARNILLSDSEIHHNVGYGIMIDGYQVQIDKTKIHHSAKAGRGKS